MVAEAAPVAPHAQEPVQGERLQLRLAGAQGFHQAHGRLAGGRRQANAPAGFQSREERHHLGNHIGLACAWAAGDDGELPGGCLEDRQALEVQLACRRAAEEPVQPLVQRRTWRRAADRLVAAGDACRHFPLHQIVAVQEEPACRDDERRLAARRAADRQGCQRRPVCLGIAVQGQAGVVRQRPLAEVADDAARRRRNLALPITGKEAQEALAEGGGVHLPPSRWSSAAISPASGRWKKTPAPSLLPSMPRRKR